MSARKRLIIIGVTLLCLTTLVVGLIGYHRNYHFDEVEFTVEDTLPDGGGKKATVILLGGQSNASGCSRDEYLAKNVTAEKYAEYQNGYDNVYINYYCSGTNESHGFVKCAAKQGEGGGFFGPELGLAEKLNEIYPDEQFFIIKYAWGGSNLYEQWRAPSLIGGAGDLYRSFVSFTEQSIDYLLGKNYDVRIAGVCWMQGESDSLSLKNAKDYRRNLSRLIKDVRRRFECHAAEEGIAFVDATIADNPLFWTHCDTLNAAKRAVSESSPLNYLIDTNAAGMTCLGEPSPEPDVAHYDSMSEITLGHLFARELSHHLTRD